MGAARTFAVVAHRTLSARFAFLGLGRFAVMPPTKARALIFKRELDRCLATIYS